MRFEANKGNIILNILILGQNIKLVECKVNLMSNKKKNY